VENAGNGKIIEFKRDIASVYFFPNVMVKLDTSFILAGALHSGDH